MLYIYEDISVITKEEITHYEFITEDILKSHGAQRLRSLCVQRAVQLGNGSKQKVKIVFETTAGTRMVETTVWGAAEDTIVIKNGISIPIHAIREIGF